MSERCPFVFIEVTGAGDEIDFCKLDERRCNCSTCAVLKAIREKRRGHPDVALNDSKNYNKGQFLGPYKK